MGARISDRIAAIAESATLAVDAKAKALKAAGRPVIGFGAGEPDFPTPDYIVEAAVAAARDPKYHHYTPVAGLPELRDGDRGQDPARHRLRRRRRAGAGHQRRQAGRLQRLRHAARPGRRGAADRPVLDDLPRGDQARRRRAGRGRHRRDDRLPRHGRAARGRADRAHQGAAVRLAVQPDRRGLPARAGRGDRRAGPPSTACGSSPTRSTSTSSTATRGMSRWPPSLTDSATGSWSLNGVAKTYAMTGWRVGWLIGPDRRRQGRDQSPVARHLQRVQRRPGRRARRGPRRPVGGAPDARGVRPAAAHDGRAAVARSRASCVPSRRARSTPTRR